MIRPRGFFATERHTVNVDTGDESFESVFVLRVLQDHEGGEALARSVVTSEWREALVAINRDVAGLQTSFPATQAAFIYDSFYLAVSPMQAVGGGNVHLPQGQSFMALPLTFFKSPEIEAGVRKVINEMQVIERVIDRLPGPTIKT